MKKTMKTQRTIALALVALAGLLAGPAAHAGVIINNAITGTVTNTFEGLPSGNVAGFISQTGATYGERFAGQILSTAGGFDSLTGLPTTPLTLVANPTLADNIGITAFGSQVVFGDLGGLGGEGALTILLGLDTTVIGFDVVGSDGGAFTTQFFGRNGALLASITQVVSTDAFFGFAATAGDVIAGVSITNTDPAGLGYDNVTFNQVGAAAVPEPALLALFALGLVSLGIGRRRTA